MPISSLHHPRTSGSTLFAVLSLTALDSLDQEKIDALKSLNINTVGDLLHFKPLIHSQILMAISRRDIGHEINLENYLDNSFLNTSPSDIPDLKIIAIEGIGGATEKIFNDEFGVVSIRELAVFAPFVEAQAYLVEDEEVFNEPASAPEDLMPKILGSTSSIARFSNFVMDEEIRAKDKGIYTPKKFTSIFSNTELVDLFDSNGELHYYIGYLAGFKQSWINMGTHLGEIIHSLALAPGESRNILFVEWRRRLNSNRSENTNVDETLTNSMTHNRALDEVTRVTAKEHQSGYTNSVNNTVSTATSESKGFNIGGAISAVADLTAVVGFPITAGAETAANYNSGNSSVHSNNMQVGTIQSSSSGNRDIVGEMTQNITEATLQNSSNIRSLWSTVVVTDEQSEREDIQTRNVTNYNHSHAMTMMYYEVLQKYCIRLELNDWTPLFYLPFKPISFSLQIISKYWHLLKIPLKRYFPDKFDKYHPVVTEPLQAGINGIHSQNYKVKLIKVLNTTGPMKYYRSKITSRKPFPVRRGTKISILDSSNNVLMNQRMSVSSGVFPVDTDLDQMDKIVIQAMDPEFFHPPRNPSEQVRIDLTVSYFLEDDNNNQQIITKSYERTITFEQLHRAKREDMANGFVLIAEKIGEELGAPSDEPAQSNLDLVQEVEDHFNQTKYGYTRYLISSLEKEQLIDIIENLWIGKEGVNKSKRLTDYIYPASLAVSDNLLIFKTKKKPNNVKGDIFWDYVTRMNLSLDKKKKETVKCEYAYLPTSGVFAEAILGRSNASEFVDPRRFWNWQDSPIPHLAPEIASVQAGNHVVTDQTGVLSANVPASNLNVINPPQYSLPNSLNSALQAVQNGNMFRDMSKPDQLVQIMSTLADLANNTAQVSGNLTGESAKNALKGAIDLGNQVAGMMRNAENILKEGSTPTSAPTPKTQTEKAAALNNLDNINKKLKNGKNLSPIDKAMANAFGTTLDNSKNPNDFIASTDGDFLSLALDDYINSNNIELDGSTDLISKVSAVDSHLYDKLSKYKKRTYLIKGIASLEFTNDQFKFVDPTAGNPAFIESLNYLINLPKSDPFNIQFYFNRFGSNPTDLGHVLFDGFESSGKISMGNTGLDYMDFKQWIQSNHEADYHSRESEIDDYFSSSNNCAIIHLNYSKTWVDFDLTENKNMWDQLFGSKFWIKKKIKEFYSNVEIKEGAFNDRIG